MADGLGKRRFASVGFGLLLESTLTLGCTDFQGLKVAGGVSDSGCDHATVPARPLVIGGEGSNDFVVVVRTVDMGEVDDATGSRRFQGFGYDLDNHCTNGNGPFSCIEPHWATADHRDGPGGRDNAMGADTYDLLRRKLGSATQAANSNTALGTLAMAIRIRSYNGSSIDDQVDVAYYGVTFHPDASGQRTLPLWDGHDAWDVFTTWLAPASEADGGQSFAIDRPLFEDHLAYVNDNVLVSKIDLVLVGADYYYLSKAVMSARLVAGSSGWSLKEGTFAGRLKMDDLLASLEQATDPVNGQRVCTDAPSYAMLKQALCSYADINYAGVDDGSAKCDAASWAWKLEAQAAALVGVTTSILDRCSPMTAPSNDHCDTLP